MGFVNKMQAALTKDAATATPGYRRWQMAATALLIHFGQAYGFSVFNGPLVKVLGSSLGSVGWIFSVTIIFLGLSAIFGKWVGRVGPRKAMLASALCFFSDFLVSALGVVLGSLPVVILGYDVIGGTGLGIG